MKTQHGYGKDICMICGFSTTHFRGDAEICGMRECHRAWNARIEQGAVVGKQAEGKPCRCTECRAERKKQP